MYYIGDPFLRTGKKVLKASEHPHMRAERMLRGWWRLRLVRFPSR